MLKNIGFEDLVRLFQAQGDLAGSPFVDLYAICWKLNLNWIALCGQMESINVRGVGGGGGGQAHGVGIIL